MPTSIKVYLLLVAVFFVHPFTLTAQRGLKPVPVTINNQTANLYAESHALVLGISDYEHWPSLPGVKKDVVAVKQALESNGFNVVSKLNLDKTGLQNALEDFIARYGHKRESRLVIYFAGHGHTVENLVGPLGYIVPGNAPRPDNNIGEFQRQAMEMEQIQTYAKRINSKHALFLFDACFSGSLFALSRAVPAAINYKTKEPVRQFITSGRADETVPDESIFRAQFVRALTTDEADGNKDGYLTGSELGEFLQTTVLNYSYESQHPQYGKIRNPNLDKGDFVFVLNPSTPTSGRDIEIGPAEEVVQYGSIALTTERSGALYVDGQQVGSVQANTRVPLNNIRTGRRKLQIGEWEETVVVRANTTSKVTVEALAPDKFTKLSSLESKTGLSMVVTRGSSFQMGSNDSEAADDEQVHRVQVGDFAISKYEVTVQQFARFVAATGYTTDAEKKGYSIVYEGEWKNKDGINWRFGARGNRLDVKESSHPVVHVSWNDAMAYAQWAGGDLPTEAEWEYAARGGEKSRGYMHAGSNNPHSVGWNASNSGGGTHAVGRKTPNELGLYDMSGNVWEWCKDWYGADYYSSSPVSNPQGPVSGTYRVMRGGSWTYNARSTRVAFRNDFNPDNSINFIGFRVVYRPSVQ